MTDDPPGPPPGELRAASANLMAATLAASMFPHALKAAAERERYLLDARTIGAGPEEAERVLTEVDEELSRAGHPPSWATQIAYRRLLDADAGIERPAEPIRTVARQALLLGGERYDPESVDRLARSLESFQPPEQRPLTAEQAVRVVADLANCMKTTARRAGY